jgi:hypothetical protein
MVLTIVTERLVSIATYAEKDVDGPPSVWLALQGTCKAFASKLSTRDNPAFQVTLFRLKFDVRAPERRLEFDLDNEPTAVAQELRLRFEVLHAIRHGKTNIQSLFKVQLMLLEDDGKNASQLRWARLGSFLDTYLSQQLLSAEYGARPPMDEMCSLAVTLLWQWTILGHGARSFSAPSVMCG